MIDLIIQDTFTFMNRIEVLIEEGDFMGSLKLIDEARQGLTLAVEKRAKLYSDFPDSLKIETHAEV